MTGSPIANRGAATAILWLAHVANVVRARDHHRTSSSPKGVPPRITEPHQRTACRRSPPPYNQARLQGGSVTMAYCRRGDFLDWHCRCACPAAGPYRCIHDATSHTHDAISSCILVRIAAELILVQFDKRQSSGLRNMSSLSDLDELVDLLLRAQEVSERAECTEIKLLIELAMFKLGTSIAQQSMKDMSSKKADLN